MSWLVGYPREKVNWHPTIDPDKCLHCGMCMNCGHKVYRWVDGAPRVEKPEDCLVGCNTCKNLCLGQAISFPDVEELRELYRKEGIWAKVKKELKAKGIIT